MVVTNLHMPHGTAEGVHQWFGYVSAPIATPLNLVQRRPGHTHLATTAVFAYGICAYDQAFARPMATTRPAQYGPATWAKAVTSDTCSVLHPGPRKAKSFLAKLDLSIMTRRFPSSRTTTYDCAFEIEKGRL